MDKIQTVILCGGKGLRLGKGSLPKALVPIGEKPILWHIMSLYASYGLKDFVLCLGYGQERIREYFQRTKSWGITFVDTGVDTHTGGRIAKIRKYIKGDCFFVTYGDGLANIDLNKLLRFHKENKRAATITVAKPYSPFGVVGIEPKMNLVTHFEEKPLLDHWINAGFFVFNQRVFDYLKESHILEKDTFVCMAKHRQLCAYKHRGFWECMDTYKDNLRLNELWSNGRAPWALWEKKG